MKNIIITLSIILLSLTGKTFAQQDPHYSFYLYNMNVVNPAYAGSGEEVEFALGVRSQWAGVEGAPESQSAIFGMPVGKNVGLGVSILNDKTFIETQTWLAIDVSYSVQISPENQLFFGVKGSANTYDANTAGLLTYGVGQDASLLNYDSRFTPNVGAGIYWKNSKYFISASIPKLLTPERLEERNGDARVGTDKMHVYVAGGYEFELSQSINLYLSNMLRFVTAAPVSYELTTLVGFSKRFTLGAGYRFNESFSGLLLFDVGKGFDIGYAYENAIESPVSSIDAGTHELFMRIRI
ncbi:PorP/SprF family type IX secretion system membrane protein [Zobellia uliginosa]|uniref:PorP/SprF family type IX secretion system membrane protein n=1 Tax=Zobellia uliginosa TaxID=143224 RepID=UPI0026E3E11F|nr:type IX secretion system membrane protein PorP/SprF [Zobellia uliginosa]MDO6517280.1 type IX secretion system membrane protein PorP/SprF [Zobellia uliginosa]